MMWTSLTLVVLSTLCFELAQPRVLEGRNHRALPPAYLSVQGHQQCLATFQASNSHTERCLPLKPLTECPVQTWAELQAVLADGKPVQRKIGARAVRPSYLSIEGHELCLSDFQASETHREICLPAQKPADCAQEAWDALQTELQDSACPPPTVGGLAGLPPAYLTVNGYQDCLQATPGSESHQVYCLPQSKPSDCDPASFEELKKVFDGLGCPVEKRARQSRAGPPAYLSVPLFRKCLGEQTKPGGSHSELCMPTSKPADCPAESWDRLGKVFVGDQCLPNQQGRQGRAGPPAYLSVPNVNDCLDKQQRPGESHQEWCMPNVKKAGCPDSSWQKLKEVFTGDKCSEQQKRVSRAAVGLQAPAYLSVENFQSCLGEHQRPEASFTERCLPQTKPADCPQASYDELIKVFTGDKCNEFKRASRQVGLGAPGYLSVPQYEICLLQQQDPETQFTTWCQPSLKPADCPDSSWEALQTVFEGDCDEDDEDAELVRETRQIGAVGLGAPAYLSVPNFKDCLSDHQRPDASHSELCLPADKPAACPQASWDSLVQVFTGDKCSDQARVSRQVVGLGAPAYLSVPNFKDCLGTLQKPGESHTQWCLLEKKPASCPDASFETLVKVFTGEKCQEQQRGSRQTVGLGAPAYLSVPNFKDCLSNHQRPDASHSVLCLPDEKLAACPQASWDSLVQVFTGDKCSDQARESRQVVGLGAPAYLSVPNVNDCLGLHQQPGASFQEKCLPDIKPDACPRDSWDKLAEVFIGDKCLNETRKARTLSAAVLPPMYLSVPGHAACLGVHQASPSHTEKCLPNNKPAGCPENTWNDLTDVFEGIRCPKAGKAEAPTGLPPAYLSVEGHQTCLDVHQASLTHSEKCLPQDQPEACSDDAWQKLEKVFDGIQCPPAHIGGNQALPPAYLFVDRFEACLDLYKPTETHSEYCLPQVKPNVCDAASWSELLKVFDGIRCPAQQLGQVSANPPHILGGVGGLPPPYLGVEGHQKCLGVQAAASGSHQENCLPVAKPAECTDDAWTKLNQVFNGNACAIPGQPQRPVGGASALPPAYLRVPGHEDCLGTHQPTPNYEERCLPQFQSPLCSGSSWRKLMQVFEGIRCSLNNKNADAAPAAGAAQPDYLSVEGQENCLGYHQINNEQTVKCLPSAKPAECEASAWSQLRNVFTGIGCPKNLATAGRPEYLNVEGHEFCLGTYQASDSHTEKCLPREKLADCDDSAWEKLPAVFNGIRCPVANIRSKIESVQVDLTKVGHQLVPGYQDCLREQLASESHMEKCIPETKPESCSETAWDELESTFLGSQCRRQPNALPPHYLSVEGHEKCLETHQASASHTEMCMPRFKPDECPDDAWESLQISFEGNECREGRANPFDNIPAGYQSVPGHQECLKLFQATETHQESCLPLSKPQGCSQAAFDALQALAFQAQLPRDARQSPGLVGNVVGALPPKYLSVQGHQQCLGSHQASESHQEVCIPGSKPDDCADDAWTELKNVFVGDVCRGSRDDHVNFPHQPPPAGAVVDVAHRPGEIEISMEFCNTDGDCLAANGKQRSCNLFFLAVTDKAGVSWDGVCVPTHCDINAKCPLIGNVVSGAVSGRCRRKSNLCLYDQSLIIA